MSRDIRFRVWDKKKESFMTSSRDMNDWEDYDEYVGSPITALEQIFYTLIGSNYSLEEYTGLKDKNGKEIWEGDLLKYYSTGGVFEVVFWEGCFCYMKDKKSAEIFNPKNMEVIGNVHENPELLTNTTEEG